MPRLRVEPAGVSLDVAEHETVMDGASAQGYYWPEGCPRTGECTNCAMMVISGLGRLSPMGRYERVNLIRQRGPRAVDDPRLRLACQARIEGDVIVEKRGVAPMNSFGGV